MIIQWIRAANQDRADIVNFIAGDNPRAALKIDQLLGDAVAKLADFPMLGQAGQIAGTRELIPHASYRIVYEVDEPAGMVWVMAIVHTARCWPPVDAS